MKANFKSGSVRGVRSNSHPYRDRFARDDKVRLVLVESLRVP